MKPINALTIDVEDYFQVSAFEDHVDRNRWDSYPLRVEENTRLILDLLRKTETKATFFVLGWVAERCPDLVREIHRAGHEIACHGYGHRRINTHSREIFRDDIRRSKGVLEGLIGEEVIGYRAPSYSISLKTLWAFDELLEAGYRYDSSVFPVRHDFYGIPHWPRFPFPVLRISDGDWEPQAQPGASGRCQIQEIPITTLSLLGRNIPIAGGGYFRIFPYRFTRWGLSRINELERRPFVFYLHPWEIDPDQPAMPGVGLKSRFRHYLNLKKTESRFTRLLSEFEFTTMRNLVGGRCEVPDDVTGEALAEVPAS